MTLWKHLSQLLSILRISIYPNHFNRKCILLRWLTYADVTFETRTCFDVYFVCSNHQNRPCINYWFRIPTNAYIVIRTFEQRPCHVRSLHYKCMRQQREFALGFALIPICWLDLKWRDLFWAACSDACKLNHIRKTQTARKTTLFGRIAEKPAKIQKYTARVWRHTTLEPINAKVSWKKSIPVCIATKTNAIN